MKDQIVKKHPYFYSLSKPNTTVASLLADLYEGGYQAITFYYFRNRLDENTWEKAQIKYPKNIHAAKVGLGFEYYTTDGEKRSYVKEIEELPEWFCDVYNLFLERFESEWKIKLLLY